jgi:hypothetical protein
VERVRAMVFLSNSARDDGQTEIGLAGNAEFTNWK